MTRTMFPTAANGLARLAELSAARSVALSAAIGVAMLTGCAGNPSPPDWQMNAKAASDRAVAAALTGNARIETNELARARAAVASTGRADLLARVELAQCAARVASLAFETCPAFEPLRADAAAPERAYADYLAGRLNAADAALLPEAQRAVAANATALAAVGDPLSRLVAAGVLFETHRADPTVIQLAIATASAQGWPRPLLAWLGVQLQRAAAVGDSVAAAQLRRRIALVERAAPR